MVMCRTWPGAGADLVPGKHVPAALWKSLSGSTWTRFATIWRERDHAPSSVRKTLALLESHSHWQTISDLHITRRGRREDCGPLARLGCAPGAPLPAAPGP